MYILCPTYPQVLLFPAQAENDFIVESGKFRSSSRLPALTYYDKLSGTSIWRCAQPKSGLFNKLSKEDVALLRCIGMCNGNPKNIHHTVLIHDSRPKLNAESNKLKGGGYESCGPDANYSNCKIKFADIDNIHAVRSCFEKMYALAFSSTNITDTQSWLIQVDQTGYL